MISYKIKDHYADHYYSKINKNIGYYNRYDGNDDRPLFGKSVRHVIEKLKYQDIRHLKDII